MMRRWCLGAFFVCVATSALLARQGIVKTSDGRTFKGDINEAGPDAASVVVKIHGVDVALPRTSITSIEYIGDAQDLRMQLSKLPAGDVKGRLDLAQTAIDDGQYDVATEAIKQVQNVDPSSDEAQTLLNTIAGQRELQERKNSPSGSTTEPSAANTKAPVAATAPSATAGQFLTMDDVYKMRAAELGRNDTVRVQFLKDVRNRYLAQSGTDSREFHKLSNSDQALEIIETNDPGLTADVQIVSDPSIFRTFRSRIQPRLLAGCAASGCHGGEGSAGFYLYPDAGPPVAAYTNFYILQMSARKIEGGQTYGQGPVSRSMIDRLHPENSLILQYGLPTNLATLPHPKATGWKPIYRNEQDPRYLETLNWISSLRAITPDYGIQLELPKGKSPAARGKTPASTSAAAPQGEAPMTAPPAPEQTPATAPPVTMPSMENPPEHPLALPEPSTLPVAPSLQPTTQPALQPPAQP